MPSQSPRQVLLFAGAKSLAGKETIEVELPESITAASVLQAIGRAEPTLQGLLPACRLAVNQRYAAAQDEVPPEAELALIPPVSGG